MPFTKILCPIDFSKGSEQAVRHATRLAEAFRAELVLIHVYQPAAFVGGEIAVGAEMFQGIVDDARQFLDEAVRKIEYRPVSGVMATGTPWVEITKLLEGQPFDLCVIGTHGRTGLRRFLLGSVAENVVRHAPCAVLTVHPDDEPKPFRHVLCPTDFSASADLALDTAVALLASGGRIDLLNVIEAPVTYSGEVPIVDFGDGLDKQSLAELAKRRARIEGKAEVTAHSRIGYAGGQILAALDDDKSFDLVVMGSHGRTGVARVLLGSVAEKTVRHAHCPVLVTKKGTS